MDIKAQREDSGARVGEKASDHLNNSEMGEQMISVVQRNEKHQGMGTSTTSDSSAFPWEELT